MRYGQRAPRGRLFLAAQAQPTRCPAKLDPRPRPSGHWPYRLRRPLRTLGLPHGVPATLPTGLAGTGLITRSPSPTACALGLGPTHPQRTTRAAEPLGFRCGGFSPPTTLLIPAFALPAAPPHPHKGASPPAGTLPYPAQHRCAAVASVAGLSPTHSRRRGTTTSELLRTLSRMAASKPTSWLSARRDFLDH